MSERHSVFKENITRKIRRKRELIRPYVGGRVLHLGAVGAGSKEDDLWLHGWLADHSETIVGIDIDERVSEIEGYNLIRGDAQEFSLNMEFDTIVATNIIEHVPNPGRLLSRCAEHLAPKGVVLLTTPRTHIPWNVLRELHGGMDPHPEHKMWFCKATMTALVESQGLKVEHHETWGFNRKGTTVPDKVWRTIERVFANLPYLSYIDEYQHFFVVTA